MTAYFSLIESHMSYGLLGWGHAPQAKRIFALQRRVIRIISGAGYRDDIRHTFAELGAPMFVHYAMFVTDLECESYLS